MSKGILVTKSTDIGYSSPLDFVLDSRLKGGLKIAQKWIIDPTKDMQFDSVNFSYFGVKSHGLGYVPAVICFQGGFFGSGWQNGAGGVFPASANADSVNVYFQTDQTLPLYIVIFGERVADT